MKNKIPRFQYCLSFILMIFLAGCSDFWQWDKVVRYSESRILMGTFLRLEVCHNNKQKNNIKPTLKEVWQRLEEIELRFGEIDEKSDVFRVNHSNGEIITIGNDAYHLLKEALYINGLTDGAFDITVFPIIKLWKDAEKKDMLPNAEDIREAKKAVGSSNIELLSGSRIRLLNKESKIILGGIAKGYAVDEAARIFRENGFENFLIDAGGDLYAGGVSCDGSLWRIGIRDPRDASKIVDIINVTNTAVTTSGDYARYYVINGKRFSHIIDPKDGYPQEDVASATVIAPTAIQADALSTAISVLGQKKGISLIESLGDRYATAIFMINDKNCLNKYISAKYQYLSSLK